MASSAPARAFVLPREHGAWSMLLLPFLSGLIVAGRHSWLAIPAALAVLSTLFLREPLVVVARQAFVWRDRRPETAAAAKTAAIAAALLMACVVLLFSTLPTTPLLVLGAGVASFGVASVWISAANRQRSFAFQLASATALGASAVFASIVSERRIAPWAWWLWALASLHSAAGVAVVRTRLDLRVAAAKSGVAWDRRFRLSTATREFPLLAVVTTAALLAVAALAVALGRPWLALPAVFSAAVHTAELYRLRQPGALATSLNRVGLRALAMSVVFAVLLVTALT